MRTEGVGGCWRGRYAIKSAKVGLGVVADPCETPVSVEWTVPYERSFFHVGVHNIPRNAARYWMYSMAEYTASPRVGAL